MSIDLIMRLLELVGLIGGFLIAIGKVIGRLRVIEVEAELRETAFRREITNLEDRIDELKNQHEDTLRKIDFNNTELMKKLEQIGADIVLIKIQNAANGHSK